MPIRNSRVVPLAAAFCFMLAVPAAAEGGPLFADPRPAVQPARSGGGDLQSWQSQYGTGQAPSARRPGGKAPPRPLKTK